MPGGILSYIETVDSSQNIVTQCYNLGKVTATESLAGGICPVNNNEKNKTTSTVFSDCYNAGIIESPNGVYPLIRYSSCPNSYFDITVMPSGSFNGSSGAKGLTTVQMQSWALAYALNGQSMNGAWTYNPDGYPGFGTLTRPDDWSAIGQGVVDELITAGALTTGDGLADSPYQIESAVQLAAFACLVNSGKQPDACAKLMNDITLSGAIYGGSEDEPIHWNPIGTGTHTYTGTFEGNDKLISRMIVEHDDAAGLFGHVGGSGVIRNVGITASSVSGQTAGTLAGITAGTSKITRCFNRGAAVTGTACAGGIAGRVTETSEVASCYVLEADISVTGTPAYAGGIVGDGSAGTIHNSYYAGLTAGSITGTSAGNTGSISGKLGADNINQCYSDQSLADRGKVFMFDHSTDALWQSQIDGLNTYGGSEVQGENRIWFSSLTDEATKGMPTLTAPEMLTVTVDPSAVTESGGVLSGAVGVWGSGTVPSSSVLLRRISQKTGAVSQPGFNLTAVNTVTANFHIYGTDNAHQNLALEAGGTDLAGLAASLAEPSASISSMSPLKLYNGAAYSFPNSRTILLELASKTGSGIDTMVTRYEVQIEIKGATRSTLDITLSKTTANITLKPGNTPAKAYSDSMSITNNNDIPMQLGITGVNAKEVSDSIDVKLALGNGSDTIDDSIPITDENQGVKLGIRGNFATGGSVVEKEAYYTPGNYWMTCQMGRGKTFSYQYFMEYSLLHIGPEQRFGFDIIYQFGIPTGDVGDEIKQVVGS